MDGGVGLPQPLNERSAGAAIFSVMRDMNSMALPDVVRIEQGAVRDNRPDPEVEAAVVYFGGLNVYGAPNYRIAWGWQRGVWCGGRFMHRYGPDVLERFVLEKWVAPEKYAEMLPPEQWDPEMEAFPRHGDYEMVFTFEDPITNGYVRPTVAAVQRAIAMNRRSAERSRQEIQDGIAQEQEKAARDTEQKRDGLIEDALCGFAGKTWMPVSGPATATSRRSFE